MRRRLRATFTALLLLVVCVPGEALAVALSVTKGSSIEFLARITGGSFVAKSGTLSGSIELDDASSTIQKGVIVVRADSFETGMSMRDSHMREKYLQAEKYPLIQLDVANQKLTPNAQGEAEIEAMLTVKDVKKPQKLKVKIEQKDGMRVATSQFKLDITQFGIAQPKFAVVKMDTTIDVTARINATPK